MPKPANDAHAGERLRVACPSSDTAEVKSHILHAVTEALTEERESLTNFLGDAHAAIVSRLSDKLSHSSFSSMSFDIGPVAEDTGPLTDGSLEQLVLPAATPHTPRKPGTEDPSSDDNARRKNERHVHVDESTACFDEPPRKSVKEATCLPPRSSLREQSGKELSCLPAENSDPSFSISQSVAPRSVGAIESYDRNLAVRRLQARLGFFTQAQKVTAYDIHRAVQTLTLDPMHDIKLEEIKQFISMVTNESRTSMSQDVEDLKTKSLQRKMSGGLANRSSTNLGSGKHTHTHSHCPGLPFELLVDVLVETDENLDFRYGSHCAEQIMKIKDVLLSSDVNCVVAELMCLRVDDISAPVEPASWLELLEPFVGGVIILNGILIGLQTEEKFADSDMMVYVEVVFTLFFVVELCVKVKLSGLRPHFFGSDGWWNSFDFVVVVLALVDTVLIFLQSDDIDTGMLSVVRVARLTRLTRLVRIFRLQFLQELTLMVKGLIGGLRTLLWAVVLLFFILYVLGCFLTVLVGHGKLSEQNEFHSEREIHFSSLPKSMFTTFRCLLIVDCADSNGQPLLTAMTRQYGWLVPVGYAACFFVVSIGLMNLTMAIYIENTLNNAKNDSEKNKVARNRESFRVARQLKRLLSIICAAQRALSMHEGYSPDESSPQALVELLSRSDIDNVKTFTDPDSQDLQMQISRETFMLCLQDSTVQRLLDDLDVPPERAHLFDVLDADCSGELMPTELVNGLLKVRGETRRGDVVAPLLAIRALQTQVRRIENVVVEWSDGSRENRLSRNLNRKSRTKSGENSLGRNTSDNNIVAQSDVIRVLSDGT